jgi:DNA-binding IclR family transcriptional regulator
MPSPSNVSAVKSCARVVDVLDYFETTGQSARTSEVSRELGIPNSSADEILKTLAAKGYLTFNARTKQYSPSYRLVNAVTRIEQRFFDGPGISRLLTDLHEATGETVSLVAQNDYSMQCVATLQGACPVPVSLQDYEQFRYFVVPATNGLRPSGNFAAALLSTKSDTEIVEIAQHTGPARVAAKRATVVDQLLEKLIKVRHQGFATCRRSDTVQIESVAVPFFMKRGELSLVVGVFGARLFADDRSAYQLGLLVKDTIRRYFPESTPA